VQKGFASVAQFTCPVVEEKSSEIMSEGPKFTTSKDIAYE